MSDSRWRAHWHAGAVIEGSDLPPSTAPVPRGPIRRWLRARPADVIDVFVYVVVLNLAVEYVPSVLTESFTLSLLTAVLLKVVLELVVVIKGRIVAGFRAADSGPAKIAIGLGFWVVAAGSKFVVLKLEDLLFGDAVSLGGFFSVTLLIVVLLMSRAGVRRLLDDSPPVA